MLIELLIELLIEERDASCFLSNQIIDTEDINPMNRIDTMSRVQ